MNYLSFKEHQKILDKLDKEQEEKKLSYKIKNHKHVKHLINFYSHLITKKAVKLLLLS